MKLNQQYQHKATKRVAVIEKMIPRKPSGYTVQFRYIGDMHSIEQSRTAFERGHTLCL